jgi:alkyl hydroperoxide reductase subunit F
MTNFKYILLTNALSAACLVFAIIFVTLPILSASSKIRIKPLTKVIEIIGEKNVTGIKLQTMDGAESIEVADGVCIEIGLVPASQMVDFVAKDKRGQIIVSKTNATNVEGIWAAGDVTDVTQKQIAVAVGEGAKAALSIIQYFQTQTL